MKVDFLDFHENSSGHQGPITNHNIIATQKDPSASKNRRSGRSHGHEALGGVVLPMVPVGVGQCLVDA